MDNVHLIFLCLAIAVIAFLYSSVGHAGASGYIAVMSLFSLAPAAIKPTALVLNILVACLGTYQFCRAGYFSWRLFWPFALLSIPGAFFGGRLQLPVAVLRILIGIVLFVAFIILDAAAILLLDPKTLFLWLAALGPKALLILWLLHILHGARALQEIRQQRLSGRGTDE